MKTHSCDENAARLERKERVVLDPADPVLQRLKTRFDRGALPWGAYCFFWDLRIRRLRHGLNPGNRTGTSWLHLLRPECIPSDAMPVIINNYNRLDSLRKQIEWLQSLSLPVWIVILDNASQYPPLLTFYDALDSVADINVVKLGYNSGLEGLQVCAHCLRACPYVVITDPDLVPYATTPVDILERMRSALETFPEVDMVGASLEIEDIPDAYPLRSKVEEWESRFWPPAAEAIGDFGFSAWVDTTFAMYRKGVDVLEIEPAMRLDRPYTLKHVDWYTAPDALSDEQAFYARVSQPIASWTSRITHPE